jgi:hypothetical protein
VTTWAVFLRDRDSEDYALEATYRGLTRPTPGGGPYLAQEQGQVCAMQLFANSQPPSSS